LPAASESTAVSAYLTTTGAAGGSGSGAINKPGVGVPPEPAPVVGGTPGTLITPLDDHADSAAAATEITVDAPATTGTVGGVVQAPDGSDTTDAADFFTFHLNAGTTYAILVKTTGAQNVSGTLFGPDGTTNLGQLEFGYNYGSG